MSRDRVRVSAADLKLEELAEVIDEILDASNLMLERDYSDGKIHVTPRRITE